MDLLAQMATFVRVVDGKSLSAAARSQRLSLPAVSRQLSALESELGVTLLVRSTRRLHVTDAGRRWYAHCVRILQDVEEARASVRDTRGVRGTLVVSASLTFGSLVLVPRLAELMGRHPQLVVDLRLEDRLADLVGEGVDLAIRAGTPPPDSTAFVAHPLGTMYRVLVAAPRFIKKHGMPRDPAQLTRAACLAQVTPAGTVIQWTLRAGEETKRVEGRAAMRSNAPIALRDVAVSGAGIAYLPEFLVKDDLARRRLRRVLPAWRSPPLTAWALYRTELRGSPRIAAFLEGLTLDSE